MCWSDEHAPCDGDRAVTDPTSGVGRSDTNSSREGHKGGEDGGGGEGEHDDQS